MVGIAKTPKKMQSSTHTFEILGNHTQMQVLTKSLFAGGTCHGAIDAIGWPIDGLGSVLGGHVAGRFGVQPRS